MFHNNCSPKLYCKDTLHAEATEAFSYRQVVMSELRLWN